MLRQETDPVGASELLPPKTHTTGKQGEGKQYFSPCTYSKPLCCCLHEAGKNLQLAGDEACAWLEKMVMQGPGTSSCCRRFRSNEKQAKKLLIQNPCRSIHSLCHDCMVLSTSVALGAAKCFGSGGFEGKCCKPTLPKAAPLNRTLVKINFFPFRRKTSRWSQGEVFQQDQTAPSKATNPPQRQHV